MKKTLLITLEYPPMVGGVANYYKNLVNNLPAESIEVLDNADNKLLSTSRLMWPKWLRGLRHVKRIVEQENIKHILVGQILPIGTIALILKKLYAVPYTVMTHAMDVTQPFTSGSPKRKQWLIRAILKNAHSVTTVSSFTRNKLQHLGVSPARVYVVYPCPNIDGSKCHIPDKELNQLDEKYNIHDKRIILSVGRLVQRKGMDTVIKAFAPLKDKLPNTHYVIAGDGEYKKQLEQLVRENKLTGRVHFVGNVSNEELARWYARCEVFVMPSRQLHNNDVEGFGMVFVEANSFGKPVIGGKSGGVSDAVIDGKTGFLVDPEDAGMLTEALDRILSNESEAIRLGYNGSERVKETFQWEIQARQLQELLNL
ncbi:MAG: glycosyltransferase family 4 protein [Candidatus Kerfeldbacteria bacterium]